MPLRSLQFRTPAFIPSLREALACACPAAPTGVFGAWAKAGVISVDGRPAKSLDASVYVGARVEVALSGLSDAGIAAAAWPLLRASTEGAFVLTPASPYLHGSLDGFDFDVIDEREGMSELSIRWTEPVPVDEVEAFELACAALESLARAGLGVLGDPFHGGVVFDELGPAWRSADEGPHGDAEAWPSRSPFAGADAESEDEGARPAWGVSDATVRVLARGHPWIRLDDETKDPSLFRPGERVDVASKEGLVRAQALVEGAGRSGLNALKEGDVAGRVISTSRAGGDWSIEGCVARAVARRAALINDQAQTDAFRLVHGEADGLPGLHIDRLGPQLRVLVTARCALPLIDRVLIALGGAGPQVVPNPWCITVVVHLDDRVAGRFERVRVHPFSADPERAASLGRRAAVREAGLEYAVEPGLGEPERSAPGYGLFLDQRENRARFSERASRGGRFLNLFAHTGAFSVAWLAAGADEVVSVDLSAAYLRWLDENLQANAKAGVDFARHVSVRQDGRRYLERLSPEERFDGIVLDPPTAAAAGRRFFSVRRDAVPMIADCLRHLAPGGRLLVTLNDRKARRRLDDAIVEAARSVGVEIAATAPAMPSADFPRLEGFAEGDPFAGRFVDVV